ncbi:MAG: AI-2E family transporter [Oscillospiraceae bacterium]|nr:AI-2E family transporter [Oscillospiraceae bacterium]
MRREKLRSKAWYPYAVAACIAVLLYVGLTNLGVIKAGVSKFLGYFSQVIMGGIIAYMMNPLARFYERIIFKKIKKDNIRWLLSVALAVITVLLVVSLLLATLIPQLIDSITTFANNFEGYAESFEKLLEEWGVSTANTSFDIQSIISSSENTLNTIIQYIAGNLNNIISTSAAAGRGIFNVTIGFILSLYLLANKNRLKNGALKLMSLTLPEKKYDTTVNFLRRCDTILVRYVTFNILDAIIVGIANVIFMTIAGMPYAGLVSFLVAMTNLVPTFGPLVGAVIGGFILLMIKPWYALLFLIFTLILQACDAYIIKPRLFGNSLGVSGLFILIAIIVGGNVLGMAGILLAIPFAAIVDFVYHEALLPRLESIRKKEKKSGGKDQPPGEGQAVPPDDGGQRGDADGTVCEEVQ